MVVVGVRVAEHIPVAGIALLLFVNCCLRGDVVVVVAAAAAATGVVVVVAVVVVVVVLLDVVVSVAGISWHCRYVAANIWHI